MVCTSKEKTDIVYKAFLPYIQEHSCFDIVYSKKIGYVRLCVKEEQEEEAVRMRTWEDLLRVLSQEVALDVMLALKENAQPSDVIQESCRRVEEILKNAEADQNELIASAEEYIRKFVQRED